MAGDAGDADHTWLPSAPPPGTILAEKYRVERVLGTGAMGVVAAAHHLQLDIRVAIKYLFPEALEYPEVVQRFAREARAAAQIRSEHVARVIDVGALDSGVPFMVLEYLEGEDLATHLAKRGKLPVHEAVRYVLEMCEALAEAHTAKIVHRDLKPANLFLAKQADRRRIVKVLDFGISKIMDEQLTTPSQMLGTAQYMSPEQLRSSKQVDHTADIWALGIILYELLSGVRPFVGRNIIVVAESVRANVPTPLTELVPDVPQGLQAVVSRCLQSVPSDRYASVLDLAIGLGPFADPRDRESIRTISGVVCGSLPPPSRPAGIPAIPQERNTAAWRPPRVPQIPTVPVARSSEMPVTTVTSPARQIREQTATAETDPTKTRRSHGRSAIIAFAVVAATLAVTVLGNRASVPPRGATPPPDPSTLVVPARPTEVWVRLSASPAHARVRIDDGEPLAMPLAVRMARDDREHRLQVEAEGCVTRVETVRFTSDFTATLALTPAPPP